MGRDEHEDRGRGRFLQGFEQRVLRRGYQRVGIIDNDGPTATLERTVPGSIDDVPYLLDLDRPALARLDDEHVRVDIARDACTGGASATCVEPE
jgi:hypothetical protein